MKVGTYRGYWYCIEQCTMFKAGKGNVEGKNVKIRSLTDRKDWHVYGGYKIGVKRVENRIDRIISGREGQTPRSPSA